MTFGENLAMIRKKAGLSQESLSEQLHITRQAISKWEAGQSLPDAEVVLKLCDILNVTPNALLMGIEDSDERKKVDHHSKETVFIVSAIFLMVIFICGVFVLCYNLFNGNYYEPKLHNMAEFLMAGAVAAYAAMAAFKYYRNRKDRA